jgi:hypothetical protein
VPLLWEKWPLTLDGEDQSPLDIACSSNTRFTTVRFILEKSPKSIEERDNHGRLPLHHVGQSLEVVQMHIKLGGYVQLHVPDSDSAACRDC